MDLQLTKKRDNIATWVKWGLAAAAVLAVAPVIFLLVKGLLGLAIALTIAGAIVNFAPLMSMAFANWSLKGIKAQARANPIETLENQWRSQQEALGRFRESIRKFRSAVLSYQNQVGAFKDKFPADAPKFTEQLQAMQQLLALREGRYQQAKAELSSFESEIQRARAIWEMGQAAQTLTDAAGVGGEDFMSKIKTETALDAVQLSMNQAFAELETSLLDETPIPTLTLNLNQPAKVPA